MVHPSGGLARLRPLLMSLSLALACSAPSGDQVPDAGDSAGDDSEAARIQVGDTLFRSYRDDVWERFDIPFVYTNFRTDTLYHPTCRPNGDGAPTVNMGLQRRLDEQWVDVWVAALPACLSEPIVIAPLGSFRDTLEVYLHPQDTLHQPRFNTEVDIDGTYRLIWYDLLRTYDPEAYPFGEALDPWERMSTTFELRRARSLSEPR